MRVPLHLKNGDFSRAASFQRLEHSMAMQRLNPSGFRTVSEKQKSPTRNEWLSKRAGLS